MEHIMKQEKYKNYTINIILDSYPVNPREEWDNIATMVCFHKRYSLGDKHNISIDELKDIVKRKDVIALPLFLYDHSGVTMRTSPFSCKWDSGQVGYIYIEYDKVKKEYGVKNITKKIKDKVVNLLMGEVAIYDAYISGNVYGYEIINDRDEFVDSCCGFYGNKEIDYMLEECKNNIDSIIQKEEERNALDHYAEIGEMVLV